MTVALRAQYGALVLQSGDSASPFTQRFFAGGQSSNRGFEFARPGAPDWRGAEHARASDRLRDGGICESPRCRSAATDFRSRRSKLRIHTDFILEDSSIVPFVDASRA